MLKRIITSVIGLVIFFTFLFATDNPIPFNCALCVVVGIMLTEVYRSIKAHKVLCVVGFTTAVLILSSILLSQVTVTVVMSLSVILYFISMVFLHGKIDYREITSHCLLTYYITFFMGSLMMIRNEYGVFSVLLVFVCAWLTDTGAYFSGRFLGKHKLIPHVSPKKTVEGAVGGIILCVVSVFLYINVLGLVEATSIVYTLIFGVLISVMSQLGDLVASCIKRDCNIKDFGNLLPGHGGLVDRFDSVMFIAPVVLYLMKFM